MQRASELIVREYLARELVGSRVDSEADLSDHGLSGLLVYDPLEQ